MRMRKTVSLLASTGAAGALILGSALPAGADPNSPNVLVGGAARCPASIATGVAITTSAGESDSSGVSATGFYSLSLQQVPTVGTVATFSVECSNGADSFSRTRVITRPISGKLATVNLFS
ncbi:hypothetical protein I6A60_11965 [Frankia sp. AgB1.9]|nr:hypothetical protein [Frankia sp. AgW1.1]MBL7548585.1 hypothetical protein [Frankia sp. AgB1.9]MBL7622355.1 hypothetical protein [Frankia sp. AgB1.8]